MISLFESLRAWWWEFTVRFGGWLRPEEEREED